MFVCHCSSLKAPEFQDDVVAFRFQVCRHCRKRVSSGRDGSFTQFVFRYDNCRCDEPDLVDVAIARHNSSDGLNSEGLFLAEPMADEQGLKLPAASFPLDRFNPLLELGRGASGAVYLCRDRLLNTHVAVKVLHYLTSEQLLSFQHEARAISRLSHPNIVKILDFGATESGIPYMVLEYIEGLNLQSYVNQFGRLEREEIVDVISSVCDALSYSHAKEIFHRDLKPSNILIVRKNRLSAKLVDFGVARVKFETIAPTVHDGTMMIGTPAYMSPDQMRGISYDHRSETYSIGCILFELVTGKQVYAADSALEIATLHATAPIPRISDIVDGDDWTSRIDEVLARCLAKDPESRYSSVDELKNELQNVQQSHSDADRPTDTASGAAESSDGDDTSSTSSYTDAVLHSVYQKAGVDRSALEDGAISANYRARRLVLLSTLALLGLLVLTVFFYSQARKAQPKTMPKMSGGAATDSGIFVMTESKFNVNRFNGNYWLFNMSPVTDSSIDEVLQSPHSKRLWFDSGSLSPETILRLKPIGVLALALINIDLAKKHLESVAQLSTIKALRLFNIANMTNASLAEIAKMNNLTELFIRSGNITDGGVVNLESLSNLKSLSLDRCTKLTDRCLDSIEKLKGLERLSLTETSVSKAGVLRVAKMKNLRALSVAKLPCDSECIRQLMKLNPQRLSLRFIPVSRTELLQLSQSKGLTVLDVRDCGVKRKDVKAFNQSRQAKGLPPCFVLFENKMQLADLGEMVFETLDYEHLWTDWDPTQPAK